MTMGVQGPPKRENEERGKTARNAEGRTGEKEMGVRGWGSESEDEAGAEREV